MDGRLQDNLHVLKQRILGFSIFPKCCSILGGSAPLLCLTVFVIVPGMGIINAIIAVVAVLIWVINHHYFGPVEISAFAAGLGVCNTIFLVAALCNLL
jgi:hypothetical protein